MALRFVVTGTGRSGTGYAASLFTAAGLPCGHEAVFTERPAWGETAAPRVGITARAKEPLARLRESRRREGSDLAGDASWMAGSRLADFSGVSFLQLRHPLLVVRSFAGTRFFSRPEGHRAQHRFAAAHMAVSGDDVLDAMRWWVFWNEMAAQHADLVYRLEALTPALFAQLLVTVGAEAPAEFAAGAFASVPDDVNSGARRGDAGSTLTWADLPAGPDKNALAIAAERWGYDPSDGTRMPLAI